jgi:hypothetical protein
MLLVDKKKKWFGKKKKRDRVEHSQCQLSLVRSFVFVRALDSSTDRSISILCCEGERSSKGCGARLSLID